MLERGVQPLLELCVGQGIDPDSVGALPGGAPCRLLAAQHSDESPNSGREAEEEEIG
ncbi:MAG: hypothetical protein ACP5PB_10780 [Acidimicrobiales bacterium]